VNRKLLPAGGPCWRGGLLRLVRAFCCAAVARSSAQGAKRPERAVAAMRRPLRAVRPAFKTYRKSSPLLHGSGCPVPADA